MGGRRRRSGGRVEGARARGIALVVVLWTLLLLSLIAAGFMAVTRTEVQLARNALANARAEALAVFDTKKKNVPIFGPRKPCTGKP